MNFLRVQIMYNKINRFNNTLDISVDAVILSIGILIYKKITSSNSSVDHRSLPIPATIQTRYIFRVIGL